MKYEGQIIDAHTHIMEGASGAKALIGIEDGYGYPRMNALSAVAWGGAAHNAQCLALKLYRPDSYVFGSVNHTQAARSGKEGSFRHQCEQLIRMGVDGFKMIEGKPNSYRLVGKALNDSYYDELYAFAEEGGYPILAHVGDPPECWDLSAASEYAIENGWVYPGDKYPSLDELFEQVEDVVTRFPKLHLILAHFYFHSHRMADAAAFLDRHPCVSFDICPGTEMYLNFSKDPAGSREFFMRYQDRLIFGTDNWDTTDAQEVFDKNEINRMIHSFLQESGTFPVWDKTLQGIDLPVEVLEKIYRGNFERLAGTEPRRLNRELLRDYCQELQNDPERFGALEQDIARVREVLETLEQ